MSFKPNFDLLREWRDAEHGQNVAGTPCFVAVFRCCNKTLVYMCDMHMHNMSPNISFNMVDMCFADDFEARPNVLLIEKANDLKKGFGWYTLQTDVLAYAGAVAEKKDIPVVFADLSEYQAISVLQSGFPNDNITNDVFHKVVRDGPSKNKMCEYLNKSGRDRFMLENIAVALNKYDTVFAIFGTGHYEAQRLVLEDMMGKPEYITRIKNMRDDFSNVKINPIKLCDFKLKK